VIEAPRFLDYGEALREYNAARCRTNSLTDAGEDDELRAAEDAALVRMVEAMVGLQTDFLEGLKAAAESCYGTLADNLRRLCDGPIADLALVRELFGLVRRLSERIERLEREVVDLEDAYLLAELKGGRA
jgi:hypothetical protein